MLHEKLDCYRMSVKLAEELSKEGAKWPRGFGCLIDQQRRAMASTVLNLAEGNARKSYTERRRFFEIARASLAEVAACVDLSSAFGLIGLEKKMMFKSQLTDVSKMIWGLMR
jgi:four helix bundle protein